ncbi:MAG: lysophospholipid acyltransferase family protein [Candidatus Paceibacterota bacterium]
MPDCARISFNDGEGDNQMSFAAKTRLGILRGHCGAWTIGLFFGLIVLLLRFFGKLKIEGEKKLLITAKKGRVVIMSNHPSLVEAFLLPVILSPRHLFDLNFFFWSLPDGQLFSSKTNLVSRFRRSLFRLGRCIMISRSEGRNYLPIRQLYRILNSGENIVIHPEGGRTEKGSSFVQLKKRRLRKIESNATMLIARLGGVIIPVFVDKREELATVSSSVFGLFTGKQAPMVIHIGEPYRPDSKKNSTELNQELEQKILKAGLS